MGKFNKWLVSGAMSLVVCIGLSGCSDDNAAQKPLEPIFLEPLALQCDVDATQTFDFTADINWKLTSDAIWCKISSDGEFFSYDIMGNAGQQNITIKVDDAGQQFVSSTAKLTLVREGQSEILAVVTRSPKEYKLKVLSADGTELTAIDIASNGSLTFDVEANFSFGAIEQPEWLENINVKYNENSTKATFTAAVIDEQAPCSTSGTIIFANEGKDVTYSYDVTYSGMNPEKAEIIGETPWGWSLSADATTFSASNSQSGEALTYSGSIPYKVNTLNYNCHYLCFEVIEDDALQLMDNDWIKVEVDTNDPSQVKISGEAYPAETEGERTAYVYAIPDAVYGKFMDIYDVVTNATAFVDSTMNYVMLEVTQVSDYVDTTPAFVIKGYDMVEKNCFEETDPDILALIEEKYPVKEGVYSVSADVASALTIETFLTDNEWVGWSSDNTVIIDTNGNIIDHKDVSFEPMLDSNEQYYSIMLKAIAKPYIMILKGVDGEYIKALVVKSGITLDPGTGFSVRYKRNTADLACALETDMELAASIIERYGIYEIYSITEEVGEHVFIYPHLTEDEWMAGSLDAFILADADGNVVKWQEVKFECGQSATNSSEYYASLTIQDYTIIMVFVDVDGNNRKAMVIKPKMD